MQAQNPQKKDFSGYDCFIVPWMEFPSFPALSAMLSERHADAVVVWAPAKVNLFLEVLAKRPDSYHDIATLMVAVSLYDTLVFKEDVSGAIRLCCFEPTLTTGPENLVVRAAELLRRRTGSSHGAQIDLTKRIPLAAGLAGGSTDAAATLAGLNELWRLGLTLADLMNLASELGSDIAFFFATPAAWCTGRGEQIAPVVLGRPLWLVLACPPFGMSTAAVYREVAVPEQPLSAAELLQAVVDGDVEALGRRLHNRLQPIAERLQPALAALQTSLAELNPAGTRMSGSGSSYFALCRDHREAWRVAQGLRTRLEEGPSGGSNEGRDSWNPKETSPLLEPSLSPRVFIVRTCS
jgi:4-diphosphocytidyl-2-C-methyl-D-erythritol kinase